MTIDQNCSRLHEVGSFGARIPQKSREGDIQTLTIESFSDRNEARTHDQEVGPLKGTLRSARMTMSTPAPTMQESATLKIA